MENGKKEIIYVPGRRVPTTKGEFQSLCDLYDEDSFISNQLVDLQNADRISLMKKARRKWKTGGLSLQGRREFGRHGIVQVQDKIRFV